MKKSAVSCMIIVIAFISSCANNKQVERNIIMYTHTWDEILNKGKLAMIDSNIARECLFRSVSMEMKSNAEVKAYYSSILKAFSKIHFEVDEIFGTGDRVVKRWTFTATHTGEFSGIPATGKRIKFSGATVARIKDGKIIEEIDYADDLGLMQQLGAIPGLGY